jgi:hypothetical protein
MVRGSVPPYLARTRVIEFAVFIAIGCLAGAAAVFLHERQRDVLHGGYIDRKPWHP